ncbi:hypothetical protein TNCV_1058871 [Trichonephila clavipes]|nr:hypothetical protein TNCV_1058871 [Trichonephila clavipes]
MVLKANDRRTSCPCHDEFRGPRSDYVRQEVETDQAIEEPTEIMHINQDSEARSCSMAIVVKPFSRSSVVVERKKFLINFNLEKLLSPLSALIGAASGRGSRVVLVSERGLLCHGFEPSTTKDPPCRAAMHVKSVES